MDGAPFWAKAEQFPLTSTTNRSQVASKRTGCVVLETLYVGRGLGCGTPCELLMNRLRLAGSFRGVSVCALLLFRAHESDL